MKLTRQQVFDLFSGLNAVSNLGGVKFAYAVAKNSFKLKSEVEALQKAYAAKDDFIEYDKERAELAKKHAVMVDGKPKTSIVNGVENYDMADMEKFEAELKSLQAVHKTAIDNRQKQLHDFEDMLIEEIEVDLHMNPQEHLPEAITAQQATGIMLIIKE